MKRATNTKNFISTNLSKRTGFSHLLSKKIVNDLIKIINYEIKNQKIILQGLGSFTITNKKERIGRNPKTKESFSISKRKVIKFVASKKLIDKLN